MAYNNPSGTEVENIEEVGASSVGFKLMKEMEENGAGSAKWKKPVEGVFVISTDEKSLEELLKDDREPFNRLSEEKKNLFYCPIKAREAKNPKTAEEKDLALTLNGKIDYTHQDTIKIILRGRYKKI